MAQKHIKCWSVKHDGDLAAGVGRSWEGMGTSMSTPLGACCGMPSSMRLELEREPSS